MGLCITLCPIPCSSSLPPALPCCLRSFLGAASAHFPPVLPLSCSTARSIYITDLFILFQDNFHHCSKCIWKERRRIAVWLQTLGNRGKKYFILCKRFFLLACGAGASFNFNQMSNKGRLVEKNLSLIYGGSCKQELTSQFPFASCLCFLPALVRGTSPYLSLP